MRSSAARAKAISSSSDSRLGGMGAAARQVSRGDRRCGKNSRNRRRSRRPQLDETFHPRAQSGRPSRKPRQVVSSLPGAIDFEITYACAPKRTQRRRTGADHRQGGGGIVSAAIDGAKKELRRYEGEIAPKSRRPKRSAWRTSRRPDVAGKTTRRTSLAGAQTNFEEYRCRKPARSPVGVPLDVVEMSDGWHHAHKAA